MAEGYRWIKAQVSDKDYEAARKLKGNLTWDAYVRIKLTCESNEGASLEPPTEDYVQFSIRLTQAEYAALQRKVELSNQSALKSGLPAVFKVATMASHFIVESIIDEITSSKQLRPAGDINNALAKLRGTRS